MKSIDSTAIWPDTFNPGNAADIAKADARGRFFAAHADFISHQFRVHLLTRLTLGAEPRTAVTAEMIERARKSALADETGRPGIQMLIDTLPLYYKAAARRLQTLATVLSLEADFDEPAFLAKIS